MAETSGPRSPRTGSPTPEKVAAVLARNAESAAPVPPAPLPVPGRVFAYVDNSNIWIEGQRLQAVRQRLAVNAFEAMQQGITSPWQYDFGRLYALICPPGSMVGRSILVGSKPPPNDSVWERACREGFEVEVSDRSPYSGREKQVDATINTIMMDDSYQHMDADLNDLAVLAAGDNDYVPCLRSFQRRGLRVRAVCWRHATGRQLRELADDYVELDPFFDQLTR